MYICILYVYLYNTYYMYMYRCHLRIQLYIQKSNEIPTLGWLSLGLSHKPLKNKMFLFYVRDM